MRVLIFRCELPDDLAQELTNAAQECQTSPERFAAQAVEVLLADGGCPASRN